MPSSPTPSDVHVSRPLTTISVAYTQGRNFIADRVFPRITVQKQADQYFSYDKDQWYRTDAALRAPGTESAGSGYTLTTGTYYCDVFALHKDVDDQTRANADNPINVDREATQFVTQQLMLKRDLDWTSTFMTTSVWEKDMTGVSSGPTGDQFLQWDNVSSDPIQDVQNGLTRVQQNTGYKPNVLVMGHEVFATLRNHADILDRIKYTQRGLMTEDLLAGLFGVSRIVVADAIKNTANEGATASMAFIVGKSALLCYANPNPGIMQPSAGYVFTWGGLLGASAFGTRISRFRQQNLKADRVEGEMAYDMKVIASDLGYFFTSAVA
jgi:hypothetical protein